MDYKLENEKEMTGVLKTLDNKDEVEVELLELDSNSAKKLATILKTGKITRENQDLLFNTIMIKKAQLELFRKGQSSIVKDGNRYVMTTDPRKPLHFEGSLKTLVKGSDGKDYVCSIELGNIVFDLSHNVPNIDDDIAVFSNVSATVYPFGTYRAVIEE